MTSSSSPDPLVALWTTAPMPDAQKIVADVRRAQRMHDTLYRTVLGLCVLLALLFAFEEATQRIETRGALTIVWVLAIAGGVVWHQRSRARFVDALTLETPQMLSYMIARTKRGLTIARYLYAGTPLGALAGGAITWVADGAFGWRQAGGAISPSLALIQTGAAAVTLLAMIACGIVLARMLHRQLRDLEGKLKDAEAEV